MPPAVVVLPPNVAFAPVPPTPAPSAYATTPVPKTSATAPAGLTVTTRALPTSRTKVVPDASTATLRGWFSPAASTVAAPEGAMATMLFPLRFATWTAPVKGDAATSVLKT